ncbi:MAG: AAA family ATPase [Ktedonobacteraceae bacterium]
MIILKHLTVERFRLLREINLHFPQRGSILIQGPNEAGKSALFESIYFALYGTPLTANRDNRSLDDLILYGASQACVTLMLSVGVTELTITRVIERGNGQHISLLVRKLGMPEEEPITELSTANDRIVAELGQLDGESLRNSCFIEQKGLNRLEELPGSMRETTVRKLLGLEKMLHLTEKFKLTQHDEQMLQESNERLKLAEIQTLIPTKSVRLGHLEEGLDAVTVSEDLAEISQQEADIAEQELSLDAIRARRVELKNRQQRIQQLSQADATLAEIASAYDTIAEAQRELPELNRSIAELDRREREELPALEKRVHELAELTRSFGTLERMSNDLLASVGIIKELEQALKNHQEIVQDSANLDEQIISARLQLEQSRQSFNELEERRRVGHPQLESRLQRLQGLNKYVTALHTAEEVYTRRITQQDLAAENSAQLTTIKKDMREIEQECSLAEAEAQRAQQQVDALENYWRQLSIRRQLENWQHLQELSQRLSDAEQQVRVAHQQQEKLTVSHLATRQTVSRWLLFAIVTGVLGLVLGVVALFFASQQAILASILGLLALAALISAGYGMQHYSQAHNEERITNQRMQEAIGQVGNAVATRETAMRQGGNREALAQVEHELRSLCGTVPQSREETQQLLRQVADNGESLATIQQRVTEKRNAAQASHHKLNVTREAMTSLRDKQTHLEEQRKKEDWDDIENKLRMDRVAIEDKQHEIAALAGQEGLPIPNFTTSTSGILSTTSADFEMAVAEAIQVSEREIVALDGELAVAPALAEQVKLYQDALDDLLARQHAVTEHHERFQAQHPLQQLERAREQQPALRNALQSLQDSLRQRVKPLGVTFGQTAISNAEGVAHKQLEGLHITLGQRIDLQSRRDSYATQLKDRQDVLSSHYNQLAKLSGSLGSWIVPLNPFAEALVALRTRCQQEIKDANESGILVELEKLRMQERASQAKIALCHQEIEEAHERIATMLVQRSRPITKEYTFTSIVAVWPLVSEYTAQDRHRLEEERQILEQELLQLEQQELTLSTQLQAGSAKLDVEQARLRLEQQERSYQTKKHGNLLLNAVNERLLRKMQPHTEYYMQQILPLLTSGRYHDVHLRTEEEAETMSGGSFSLRVWDTAAGEYVPKSALSGGAADQLSLALRLAFAIAALPCELATAPGFVLLDEPLSSFDRGRTQALVNVVTGEILGQHFEQVLLVSHSSAFDPAMFPYHLYLDGGVIVESNLPVVPTIQLLSPLDESTPNKHDTSNAVLAPVPETIAVES